MRYSSKQSLRGYDKAAQGSITPTIAGYVVVSDPRLPHEMKEESNNNSDPKLIVTYNIVDTSQSTQLYYYRDEGNEEYWHRGIDMFDKVEIDGTEVSVTDLDSAGGAYLLNSGEHTVVYTLKDMSTIIDSAFQNYLTITSVIIPNGVTTIGGSAFQDCSSFTSIEIPSTITSIGWWAFGGCTNITNAVIRATTPPTLERGQSSNPATQTFEGSYPIYVPSESVNAYKTAQYWSDIEDRIQAIQ